MWSQMLSQMLSEWLERKAIRTKLRPLRPYLHLLHVPRCQWFMSVYSLSNTSYSQWPISSRTTCSRFVLIVPLLWDNCLQEQVHWVNHVRGEGWVRALGGNVPNEGILWCMTSNPSRPRVILIGPKFKIKTSAKKGNEIVPDSPWKGEEGFVRRKWQKPLQRVCNRANVAPFLKISGQPDTFSLPAACSEISNARFLYLDSFIRRPLAAHSSSYFASEIVCLRVLISPGEKKSRVIDNSYLLFFEHKILINK